MKVPFVIIGGGLSGLAAAIRFARFDPNVLVLEKHDRIGGLNSYYYRNKRLIETGLHAITNFVPPEKKDAPLNRLLRQLKIRRKDFHTLEQIKSEICFVNKASLLFSNDFDLFYREVATQFPSSLKAFDTLLATIKTYDAFKPAPFKSARKILIETLNNDLLTDMILCPLMFYGSSIENDMDFGQFVIMFRSIFLEGFFRPAGTIKDFLDFLQNHLEMFGGKIRLRSTVKRIISTDKNVIGVELSSGEIIYCDHLLSTIGLEETFDLLDQHSVKEEKNRLGFIESIFLLNPSPSPQLPIDKTIIFYYSGKNFQYRSPVDDLVDFDSGVICFPNNFQGMKNTQSFEVRTTHLANYNEWKKLIKTRELYRHTKNKLADQSKKRVEKIIGKFKEDIIFEDTFTPLTVEKFTAKKRGAIYGSPKKIINGDIGFNNLYIAGTDQGFLGIIGSMLSGVSIVNQQIIPSL